MNKFLSALFAAFLLAGCAAPVRYIQVSAVSTATPAPAEQQTVVVTPTVVYVQPLMYHQPIIGIAAGYMLWRGLSGGRHGGHHRR